MVRCHFALFLFAVITLRVICFRLPFALSWWGTGAVRVGSRPPVVRQPACVAVFMAFNVL